MLYIRRLRFTLIPCVGDTLKHTQRQRQLTHRPRTDIAIHHSIIRGGPALQVESLSYKVTIIPAGRKVQQQQRPEHGAAERDAGAADDAHQHPAAHEEVRGARAAAGGGRGGRRRPPRAARLA